MDENPRHHLRLIRGDAPDDGAAHASADDAAGDGDAGRPLDIPPPLAAMGTRRPAPALPGPRPDWWDGYFDKVFIEIYRDFLTPERTEREVEGLREMIALDPGAEVLDVACGWGRHSIALARAGFKVTGLDLSPTLLRRARKRAKAAGVEVELVRRDMRAIPWQGRFDAVLSLYSSLGYFLSDREDLRVLRRARRALREGGVFVLETMHRDWIVGDFAERDWWETRSGLTVWVEREFDAVDGISREWTYWHRDDLDSGTKYHQLRLRTATEWDRLLRRAGLRPVDWYGDWHGAPFVHNSENLIVVCRPDD